MKNNLVRIMANKKKRVIISNAKGDVIYESAKKDIIIFNDNGRLYFESTNTLLNTELKTYDCAEGVAALMRIDSVFKDNKLWDLNVGNNKYDTSTERALYWLTGGNKEWERNDTYLYNWDAIHSIFEHEFSDTIYEIIDNAKTLKDIKQGFIQKLNLPILYEFALNNNLA